MLVISQKKGEKLRIGRDITITILESKAGKVRLGIEAPQELEVMRESLYRERKQAPGANSASASNGTSNGNKAPGKKPSAETRGEVKGEAKGPAPVGQSPAPSAELSAEPSSTDAAPAASAADAVAAGDSDASASA